MMSRKKSFNVKTSALKDKRYFIILVVILLISFSLFVFSLNLSSSVVSVEELDFTLNVTPPREIGFNLDTDKLHFGNVAPKGTSRRGLVVSSEEEGFVFVLFDGFDWLSVNKQGAMVRPDSPVELNFEVKVPEGESPAYFEETLKIVILDSESTLPLLFYSGSLVDVAGVADEDAPAISLNIV